MSQKFRLREDQKFELLHSNTNQVIEEYQSPPMISNAPNPTNMAIRLGDVASVTQEREQIFWRTAFQKLSPYLSVCSLC